jgi:hypothetical protein
MPDGGLNCRLKAYRRRRILVDARIALTAETVDYFCEIYLIFLFVAALQLDLWR